MYIKDHKVLEELYSDNYSKLFKTRRFSDGIVYAMRTIFLDKLNEYMKEALIKEIKLLGVIGNNTTGFQHFSEAFVWDENLSYCIVMEYAGMGTLEHQIALQNEIGEKYPESEIWKAMIQLTSAQSSMHSINYMYDFVKKDSIFYCEKEGYKFGDKSLRQILDFKPFLSENICGDVSKSIKSDIWYLGFVQLQMACLFSLDDIRKKKSEKYIKLVEGLTDVYGYSNDLKNVLLAMLNTNSSLRPSANELLNLPAVKFWKEEINFKDTLTDYSNRPELLSEGNFSQLQDELPAKNYLSEKKLAKKRLNSSKILKRHLGELNDETSRFNASNIDIDNKRLSQVSANNSLADSATKNRARGDSISEVGNNDLAVFPLTNILIEKVNWYKKVRRYTGVHDNCKLIKLKKNNTASNTPKIKDYISDLEIIEEKMLEPLKMQNINTYDLGDERSILNYKNKEQSKAIQSRVSIMIKSSHYEEVSRSRKTELLQKIQEMKPIKLMKDFSIKKFRPDPRMNEWRKIESLEKLAGYKRSLYGKKFGETTNLSSLNQFGNKLQKSVNAISAPNIQYLIDKNGSTINVNDFNDMKLKRVFAVESNQKIEEETDDDINGNVFCLDKKDHINKVNSLPKLNLQNNDYLSSMLQKS